MSGQLSRTSTPHITQKAPARPCLAGQFTTMDSPYFCKGNFSNVSIQSFQILSLKKYKETVYACTTCSGGKLGPQSLLLDMTQLPLASKESVT